MAKNKRMLQLWQSVRDILFLEWDPIGVNDNEECRDEYDFYVATIVRYLLGGVDEHKLASHLSQLELVSMGLSAVDEEANRRIAMRLLTLVK